TADAIHPGGGGGGGLSGNGGGIGSLGGTDADPALGGGGGGARGNGGKPGGASNDGAGGGGGGTVFAGADGHSAQGSVTAIGGPGGYLCGGNGGDQGNDGHDAKCDGGGGGGGGVVFELISDSIGSGGKGKYGGGGGGGWHDGGDGGFGGGGGAGIETHFGFISGGNGGFGGGGGAIAGNEPGPGVDPGKGGAYGGNADKSYGGGGGAVGGAIFSDGGTLVIHNSTFYNNFVTRGASGGGSADNGGDGGGAVFARNADLTIVDSTFSDNQSTGSGGAVVAYGDAGTHTLIVANTLMANNGTDECLTEGSVQKPANVSFANLIMSNGAGAFGPCPGVTLADDPQLGPLQDNGGFTPTMAIPFNGIAMNAGDAVTSLATDQRGVPRPQPVNGYDIGAFEVCRRALAGGLIEPMFCSETTFAGFPTTSLTIMSSTSSGGIVSPAPGTYSVPQNTVEVLSATPAPGYYLKNWTGNVAQPTSLTTTIVIGAQAQTVSANFQLHDFSLSANPTSFTLPLGGTTATSDITASALGDFGDEITLSATGHPSGIAASLSANTVTPVAGTAAVSTLTIAVGPSAVPQSFTETITGNSTGLSGALSHSAQVNVTFVITPDALVKIINQDLALGCIGSAGFAQSLIAKVKTYQTLAGAGHVQGATNVLAAFQYEVQAQIGHQIVSSCTDPVGGNAFSPGQVLLADAQALQAMLGTAVKAAPIVGFVVSTNDAGTAGRTVNLMSGKSALATASTDAVGFYYFDTTALKAGAQYSATATIPKGYKASSPASQTFTWSGAFVNLAAFILN
ncbi:MAG TPA: choice-of-anchor Q domain-containing protein, partial [Thermomicrobiales bacterium]|nr:choice-of-anchor Q domain-containing protein [Thermomicrobiales bacterium]